MIVKTSRENYGEALNLAEALKARTLDQTLEKVHGFVFNNFQYQAEGMKHDLQTLSRAWHEYRNNGINCEDATLIILQILSAMGVKAYARRIHQAQNPAVASHIYVIVPKDQKSGKIRGRDSYWVVDGTLPVFNQEAAFVKSLDSYSEPVMQKGLNSPAGLNIEPISTSIALMTLYVYTARQIYSSGFFDDQEAQRLENVISGFKQNNAFKLYPRTHEGGPWRNLGFADLGMMTKDELRYFIEWRMPMWKKQMQNKDWGDTKQRVKERYFAAQKSIEEEAKKVYRDRFGCYKHSGLYDHLILQSNGKSTLHPHSKEILSFDDNCGLNPEGSEGTGPTVSNPSTDSFGGPTPGASSPGNSGIGPFANTDITTGDGGFITIGNGDNQIKLPVSGGPESDSNKTNSINKAGLGWLATVGILGGLFYASRKSSKTKKKEAA